MPRHSTIAYKPKSILPNVANTHRLMNNPHTSAYKLRPYVATIFTNILRLGVMGKKWRSGGVGSGRVMWRVSYEWLSL